MRSENEQNGYNQNIERMLNHTKATGHQQQQLIWKCSSKAIPIEMTAT